MKPQLLSRSLLSLAIASAATAFSHSELVRRVAGEVELSKRATLRDGIVHMFQWNWNSIAAECGYFLGTSGFGYVQVSTPSEHITGSQWWTDYQPVSYTITSKHGSRAEFVNMVNTCKSVGIGIIVDVVWNHMTSQSSGTGDAGTSFSEYSYSGTYSSADFHYCPTSGHQILDWNDRTQIQTCQLVGLSDLNTESEYVRSRLAQYGNDLLSMRVAGFRLDAAKHMNIDSITNIFSRLTSQPSYVVSEVYGNSNIIPSISYTGIGQVMVFEYAWGLYNAFTATPSSGNGISTLPTTLNALAVPSSKAYVFPVNHDTERGSGTVTYQSPSNIYNLANIFTLAYSYGTPMVLSSYTFSSTDDGAPNGGYGTCYGSGGVNGWLCQHRWTPIANMIQFHNAAAGQSLYNWQTGSGADGTQQIAFARGSVGFVIINNADSTWNRSFGSRLPAGTYCDIIAGGISSGQCTGTSVSVNARGAFTAQIPARSALAFYTASKLS